MMRHEAELEADETGEQFKANIFASNPKLYYELFDKQDVTADLDGEIQFPETPEEFKEMIAAMQREGLVDRYAEMEEEPPDETS